MSDQTDLKERLLAPRRATWFELFFDLAFVLAVASLISTHVDAYALSGIPLFALKLVIVWQLWLAHTFWASRLDEDRVDQHIMGFVKLLAIVAVAFGSESHAGAGLWFVAGVGAFKLLISTAYLRDGLLTRQLAVTMPLVMLHGIIGALWLLTLLVPNDNAPFVWVALVAIEAIAPRYFEDRTRLLPPHPEHLPERFGLFTIILLGETVASALHGLVHASHLSPATLIISASGAAFGFLLWIGYYHHTRSAEGRKLAPTGDQQTIRRWVLAHLPLYLGIAGASAGKIALAGGHHITPSTIWMHTVAFGVAMAGLTCVGLASPENRFSRPRAALHMALAMLTPFAAFLFPVYGSTSVVVAVVVLTALQLAIGTLPARIGRTPTAGMSS